jgi:uncharacterized protein (DUF2141 family)
MKSRFLFTLLVISFVAQQCAKQTAPTGGPKDETPPKLIESSPANKETKFKKDKIELTFDEYLQLNNPKEQIIITPTIGKKFEVTARKNKVFIDLNSPLQENTTYNINFRESIQDITEKNPAILKLAFSTGDHIDSLSISGIVKEILTDTEVKNYTVGLAVASDTFNLFKHQPSWISLTDEKGKFKLENLKTGEYIIYAFDDKNKNLVVDNKSEKHGYVINTISLTDSLQNLFIPVFKLNYSPLKLISSKPIFSYFSIRLSKGIQSYAISSKENSDIIYSALEPDNSTIKVYNTLGTKDSLQINLLAYDSIDSKLDSTLYLKFNQKKVTKDKLQSKIDYINYLETKAELHSAITFSKPIILVNTDSIYTEIDSLTRINFSKEDLKWNTSQTKVTIIKRYEIPKHIATSEITKTEKIQTPRNKDNKPITNTKKYNELIFPKGTFISVESDTAQLLSQPIRTITPEQTGVILTNVETGNNFILQLVNKANEVIEETTNNKNHRFENLEPGIYRLRLVIDTNKNGKWDPGNILTKKEPEQIIYYVNSKNEKDINLKANWEVGPLLISH